MSALLNIAIIVIQFASVLATQPIPLKCFLQDNNFLNIFDGSATFPSTYVVPTLRSPRFGNVNVKLVSIDRDGWQYDSTNIEYQGFENAILDDFVFNLITNVSKITFHTDLFVSCYYKTNGSLFSIPIYGEGSTKASIKNIQVGMVMPFDIKEENGNKFIELRNFNYWYDVKDNALFNLTNLYYGNKELSDSMHSFINQNWKIIVSYFGSMFMDKLAENMFNVFRN